MATNGTGSWVVAEIEDDVSSADASRVAHRLGGIVANDERIRGAIAEALGNDNAADAAKRVLIAVAAIFAAA